MGADVVFDYKDPECARRIREFAKNNLKLTWDCVSLESTAKLCADAMSSGGTYGAILKVTCPRDDITSKFTLGYTCVGEPVQKPGLLESENNMADFEFMKKWINIIEPLF